MGFWHSFNLLSDAMDQAAAPGPLAGWTPRIRRQYLRLRLAARSGAADAGPVTLPILGRPMRADRTQNLLLLFPELFVRHEYACDLGRPDPVIIDGGANVGMSALYFKTAWPGASLTCVEASPAAFEHLSVNARANRWERVELVHAALAPAPGVVRFNVDPANPASPTGSTLATRGGSHAVEVPGITLSSLVRDRVDLLKLDIEGAESGVIRELASSGAIARIRRILMEYHHHLTPGDDARLPAMLSLLVESGFRFQLRGSPRRADPQDAFQDLLIHAYRP